jgi:hypothetical protein
LQITRLFAPPGDDFHPNTLSDCLPHHPGVEAGVGEVPDETEVQLAKTLDGEPNQRAASSVCASPAPAPRQGRKTTSAGLPALCGWNRMRMLDGCHAVVTIDLGLDGVDEPMIRRPKGA